MTGPKITPFLWFDHKAEQAANFYVSTFPKSRIAKILRYGAAGPGPPRSVMTVEFVLAGRAFVAVNGGPLFQFMVLFYTSSIMTKSTQAAFQDRE
jgi:predicted 3-demethylubiquinone-9 3-methyltransferase (glyoxalase superfamily)